MRTKAIAVGRPVVRTLGATVPLAVLTAIAAQVAFRLPYTPVPVTLQTFAVVLSGLLLGSRLGALAQIQYLALGLAGVPVFAGPSGGPAAMLGPSGGYLPGFVAGAFVAGFLFERCQIKSKLNAFISGMLGIAAVYIFGTAWLSVWLTLTGSNAPGLSALLLGVMPFVGIDAVKVTVAAVLVTDLARWKK